MARVRRSRFERLVERHAHAAQPRRVAPGIASRHCCRCGRSCSKKPTSCSTRWIAAIRSALREELGDFLFEAVFLAQIAEEEGHFSIVDAIQSIVDKLVRRHPHVFSPDGRPLAEGGPSLTADGRSWRNGRT